MQLIDTIKDQFRWLRRRHSDDVTITNDRDYPFPVVVEPWGSEALLLPGQSLRVIARSRHEGKFEIANSYNNSLHPDWHHPIVFAWEDAVFRAFIGDALVCDSLVAFPTIGKMTTREWMTEIGMVELKQPTPDIAKEASNNANP